MHHADTPFVLCFPTVSAHLHHDSMILLVTHTAEAAITVEGTQNMRDKEGGQPFKNGVAMP